jgi:hypothetical protein
MGDMVKRSSYRARKHLALVLLPEVSRAAHDYLLELRAGYAQIREYDGEVLAILADPTLDAEELAMRLEVPFPLLLDRERTVVTRFLPEAVPMGVFILDRYAALHTQWLLPRPDFPPVRMRTRRSASLPVNRTGCGRAEARPSRSTGPDADAQKRVPPGTFYPWTMAASRATAPGSRSTPGGSAVCRCIEKPDRCRQYC